MLVVSKNDEQKTWRSIVRRALPVGVPPLVPLICGTYHVPPMPRHADQEPIYQAQRVGLPARLVQSEKVSQRDAEHWVAAWERHAASFGPARGTRYCWDQARERIAYGLTLRQRPDWRVAPAFGGGSDRRPGG
jgi:hypothetical protein